MNKYQELKGLCEEIGEKRIANLDRQKALLGIMQDQSSRGDVQKDFKPSLECFMPEY